MSTEYFEGPFNLEHDADAEGENKMYINLNGKRLLLTIPDIDKVIQEDAELNSLSVEEIAQIVGQHINTVKILQHSTVLFEIQQEIQQWSATVMHFLPEDKRENYQQLIDRQETVMRQILNNENNSLS